MVDFTSLSTSAADQLPPYLGVREKSVWQRGMVTQSPPTQLTGSVFPPAVVQSLRLPLPFDMQGSVAPL